MDRPLNFQKNKTESSLTAFLSAKCFAISWVLQPRGLGNNYINMNKDTLKISLLGDAIISHRADCVPLFSGYIIPNFSQTFLCVNVCLLASATL